MHGLALPAPDISAHFRTFRQWIAAALPPKTSISWTFPWRRKPLQNIRRQSLHRENRGNGAVLNSRARTGFGGMITVAAVLLAAQLITGVQAFPL
jgi:hypothetical protein